MKLKTEKVLIAVIALLLLTTIFIIVVSIFSSIQVKNTSEQVLHTQEVLITAEKALSLLVSNETGTRGFILTGNRDFLVPDEQSTKEIYSKLGRLRLLTVDNPVQKDRIDSLSFYIEKRLQFSNNSVKTWELKGAQAAAALVETGLGKMYTDRIRMIIDQIQASENILLSQRTEANEKKAAGLNRILVAVIIIVLVLSIFFIQKVRFDLQERKVAAAALAELNAELEQRVKERTKDLDKSEQRFRALVENNEGIISLRDEKFNTLFLSSSASRITGWENEEYEEKNAAVNIHPDDLENIRAVMANSMIRQGVTLPLSLRVKHKNGHYIWLEGTVKNMTHDPAVGGIITNMRDVTEQKMAAEKILQVQRLYFFISQINQMIVRTTDQAILFKEACRIAVEVGQFRMSWIGMINEETKDVVPVMHGGDDEDYPFMIAAITVKDDPEGRGPTGTALREGKYFISNDIENDPEVRRWKNEAIKRGYCSCMALPIKKFGKVVGVFSFYSSVKNFFDTAEIGLLEEATSDVSFALEIFEKETLRKKAEGIIHQSEEKYRTLITQASDGIFITDENGRYLEVNKKGCELLGYSTEEMLDLNMKDLLVVDTDFVPVRVEELKAGKTVIQKRKLKRKDGTSILVEISGRILPDGKMLGMVRDLTERIESEQKLQKEKELSDKIINSLPGIFYLSDSTPRLLRWNKTMEEISGYTKEELEKIVPVTLFDPEDHTILKQGLEKTYREGSADVEVRMLTKTGQRIPFYFTGAGIDYGGKQAILGTGIDISERKKAALQLKESEEKYRVLFYNNPMPCWIIKTGNSEILDVNDAALDLYRYSRNEFLSLTIMQLRPPGEYEKYQKHMLSMSSKTIEGDIGTWQHVKKDGTLMDVEIYVHSIFYDNIPCRMILANDITGRKRAADEIIKEKNLSDSVINSLPGIFYLYTKEGKFLRWNTNFETVSGYNAAEISAMHPLDFFSDEEKALLTERITNVFISGEENVQANFLTKAKEKIPYYFTGIVINYHDNDCLMGVGIDFTERVRAQEEIKETSQQLRQLTAHLQNIREEERKRIGREIHDELGQQLTAIKMDVAWVDKKIPEETVDLKKKLSNVIKLLDGSNHSIRRILSELRPNILDDHGLLEAVEWLGNQFTQNTGTPIRFTTCETTLKLPEQVTTAIFRVYQEALTNITRYANAGAVLTSLQIADDNIIFTVKDDGQGFDTTAVKRKRSFGILGMKERISLINGKFEITSSHEEGTKIVITIPIKPE